jgi:hypothetical protein
VPKSEVGFWDRPERHVLMILGALLNRMPIALWILAIGPNITVIHRIVHTWKQLEGGAPRAADALDGAAATSPSAPAMAVGLGRQASREAAQRRPVLTRTAGRGG